MANQTEKYVNPFTDYGFKRLFGEEPSKEWMSLLDRIPNELREGIFEKLFELAEIARFSPQEVRAYEDSLKAYRDLKNALETAREEERWQTTLDIVKNSLAAGLSIATIAQITGLSVEEIEAIKMDDE